MEDPEDWRKSVTSIFKDKKEDLGNCISFTTVPEKLTDQILWEIILKHIKDMVIGSSQDRFTESKSCLTNLNAFYDKVTATIDKGSTVDILYLEVSKL